MLYDDPMTIASPVEGEFSDDLVEALVTSYELSLIVGNEIGESERSPVKVLRWEDIFSDEYGNQLGFVIEVEMSRLNQTFGPDQIRGMFP